MVRFKGMKRMVASIVTAAMLFTGNSAALYAAELPAEAAFVEETTFDAGAVTLQEEE